MILESEEEWMSVKFSAKVDSKATKETKEQVLIIKTIPRTTIGSTKPTVSQ